LAIIVVLSLITGVMAWLGVSSLHSVSDHSDTMKRSAERALLATRANNNVVAMNRAEFRSAIDPRDENRLAARAVIDEQVKQLEERLAEIAKTKDEKTLALLPAVTSGLATYRALL
jgi:methyl-accepting chemotaxis protein